jgi:imidazolonepropionase-like amidohydrolase
MQRLGIPFIASTDAGIPGVFHHHLPEALAVFARILEAEPATILRTATHNAARALGLGHLTGLLAPGYAADILLIDGDPLEDLAALTRPAAVGAAGRDVLPPG